MPTATKDVEHQEDEDGKPDYKSTNKCEDTEDDDDGSEEDGDYSGNDDGAELDEEDESVNGDERR